MVTNIFVCQIKISFLWSIISFLWDANEVQNANDLILLSATIMHIHLNFEQEQAQKRKNDGWSSVLAIWRTFADY